MTEINTPKMIKFFEEIKNQNIDDKRSDNNQKNALKVIIINSL